MSVLKLFILRTKARLDPYLPVSPRTVRLRKRVAELLDEWHDYQLWLARTHGREVILGLTGYGHRDPRTTRGRELRDLVARLEEGRRHWSPRPVVLLKSRASDEFFAALAAARVEKQRASKARRTL